MQQYVQLMEQAIKLQTNQEYFAAYRLWLQVIERAPKNNPDVCVTALERLADAAYQCKLFRHGACVISACLKVLKWNDREPAKSYGELLQKLAMLYYLDNDMTLAVEILLEAMATLEPNFEEHFEVWMTTAQSLALVYDHVLPPKPRRPQPAPTPNPDPVQPEWNLFIGCDTLNKLLAA